MNPQRLLFIILFVSACFLLALISYFWFFSDSLPNKPIERSNNANPSPPKTHSIKEPSTSKETDNLIIYSNPLSFSDLPQWNRDKHAEAWPALLKNCRVMPAKQDVWKMICADAEALTFSNDLPTNKQAKLFFETHFIPYQLIIHQQGKEKKHGLMTGYYEPLLKGSYQASSRYRYPIYAPPKTMLTIELGDLYPNLKGKRVRGRLEGNKVIPFYDRKTIDSENSPLKGEELIWVDNRDDLFFLHIQGSGRIELPNGKIIGVGYANQNGQPYRSIGQVLIDQKELHVKEVNLFTLKQWLRNNPKKALHVLNSNPSYIFFNLRNEIKEGPIGSLNVPLTAERSIAIDPKKVTLGSLMYVDTTYPDKAKTPLQKLVFAQDTGGAIKGELRADMFYGSGKQAELKAGLMKNDSQYFILEPLIQ